MENIPNGMQWAAGLVIALLGALGASKVWDIVRDARARRNQLEDRANDVHESNEANKINADVTLVKELLRRVGDLEKTQREQGEKLMTLTDTNARLDERNKALEKENTRLSEDLKEVKAESKERQGRIKELQNEVHQQQTKIVELQGQVAELMAVHLAEK